MCRTEETLRTTR